jgi:hypothetical protein
MLYIETARVERAISLLDILTAPAIISNNLYPFAEKVRPFDENAPPALDLLLAIFVAYVLGS